MANHGKHSSPFRRNKQSDWSSSVLGTHAAGSSSRRTQTRRSATPSLKGRTAQVNQIDLDTRSVDEKTARRAAASSRTETFMRHRRSMGRVWLVLAIVLIVAVAATLGTCVFRNSVSSSMALSDDSAASALVEPASENDVQYILLAGIGSEKGHDTAGFAAVMRVDVPNKKLALLIIPTGISESYDTEDDSLDTLREAPAAADEGELIQRVSELIDQDINHYVRITEEGLASLVDSLGGLTITIDQYIDDPEAGTIVLYPGEQTLSGKQALVYAKAANYSTGVRQRATYQANLFQVLIDAIEAKGGLSFAMSADDIAGSIETDMSYDELSAIAAIYPDTTLEVATVPGSQTTSGTEKRWSISSSEWNTTLENFKGGSSMESSVDTSGVDKASLSIKVLNGAGVDGYSAQVASVLSSEGYTISETGNADSFVYDETLVIYREEKDEAAAWAVVQDLGIGRAVSAGVYYSLTTDVQVVVGKDWTGHVAS